MSSLSPIPPHTHPHSTYSPSLHTLTLTPQTHTHSTHSPSLHTLTLTPHTHTHSTHSHSLHTLTLTPHTHTHSTHSLSHPGLHTLTDSTSYPTAAEILDLLHTRVAILSGGRDRQGRSIITFPSQGKSFEYNRECIRRVVQYLACIPT